MFHFLVFSHLMNFTLLMHHIFFFPLISNILLLTRTITLLELEVVTLDAPIIWEPSHYHFTAKYPSQSSSFLMETILHDPHTLSLSIPSLVNSTRRALSHLLSHSHHLSLPKKHGPFKIESFPRKKSMNTVIK